MRVDAGHAIGNVQGSGEHVAQLWQAAWSCSLPMQVPSITGFLQAQWHSQQGDSRHALPEARACTPLQHLRQQCQTQAPLTVSDADCLVTD